MSRSAADMISADGSGERLLSLRMNLDKTPMHAHGTWRTGAAKPPSPARRAEASGAALPRLGGAATASDDAPDRPLWSLQRVDASQSVAWTRTSDPLPLTRAHFEHADAAARDASLQRMFDVAEASLVDPWTRKRPPETRTLLLRHHEHLEGLSHDDAQAALAAGGGEHQFPRELLLLASRIGVEVPTPKPKRAPVPEARAAAVAGGDAPEPAAPEEGGAASAEAAPAAEQPPEVAEAAAAPAETAPAEGGAG